MENENINQPIATANKSGKKWWVWITVIVLAIGVIVFVAGYFKKNETDDKSAPPSANVEIPAKVLANKYGFLGGGGGEEDNPFIGNAGAAWMRPHPGPFLWDAMQSSATAEINFDATDKLVSTQQSQNYGTLATLWPFAEWDQQARSDEANCTVSDQDEFLPKNPSTSLGAGDKKGQIEYLPEHRCNPQNWSSYSAWVSAVVERYDGDGNADMPDLKVPIKYFEIMNEPDLNYESNLPAGETNRLNFYKQGPADYGELLKQSYSAIKAADPGAKVLIAGAAGGDARMLSFYETLFMNMKDTPNYFDIGNVHCISNDQKSRDFNVAAYKKVLAVAGITKPIWVTEAEAFYGNTAEENYQNTLVSTKGALSAGAERIFFTRYNFADSRKDMSEKDKSQDFDTKDSEAKYKIITGN